MITHIVREGNRNSKDRMTVDDPHECKLVKGMFCGRCREKKQDVHYYQPNILEIWDGDERLFPKDPCDNLTPSRKT